MSIDTAYNDDNIFAKVLRGEVPCVKVYEDDAVISFMDLFPQAPGHTLVVPKEAAVNIFDLSSDALKATIERVQTIAAAVRKALQPDGITIMQFNGSAAGQSVFHIHFHIVPRTEGASLRGHGQQGGPADQAELEALADRIRAALG
jgi:histidine triad (HIT) family protein